MGQSEVGNALPGHPAVQKAAATGLFNQIRRLIVMLQVVPDNGMNLENALFRTSRIT